MKVKYLLGILIAAVAGLTIWGIINMVGTDSPQKLTYQFAIKGDNKRLLKEPNFIVADSKNMLYVSDSGNARISVFNKKGRFQYSIGGPDSDSPLKYPLGLGVLGDTIIVADSRAGVIKQYSLKGEFLKNWPVDAPIQPAGVYVSSDSQIYITDLAGKQVLVYSDKGILKGKIKSADTDLGSPIGIWVNEEGDIWLTDSSNYNVKVLSQDGKLKNIFDGGPQWPLSMAKGLAVDEKNRVYVSDTLSGIIRIFDQKGNAIASFGGNDEEIKLEFPVGLYINKETVYVVEQGSNQVQVWAWE